MKAEFNIVDIEKWMNSDEGKAEINKYFQEQKERDKFILEFINTPEFETKFQILQQEVEKHGRVDNETIRYHPKDYRLTEDDFVCIVETLMANNKFSYIESSFEFHEIEEYRGMKFIRGYGQGVVYSAVKN